MTTQPEHHAAGSPTTDSQQRLHDWRKQKAAKERPVRWIRDEEFFELQSQQLAPGRRLVLLALRLHDLEEDNPWGAFPGHKRLAALTGLSAEYVRRILSAFFRNGVIEKKKRGKYTHYYLVPPTTDEHLREHECATGPDIGSSSAVPDVLPPEVHSKSIGNGKVIPKGITNSKGITEGNGSASTDTEPPNVRPGVGEGSRSASGDGDRSPTPEGPTEREGRLGTASAPTRCSSGDENTAEFGAAPKRGIQGQDDEGGS
jgi:hypothetical protein